ncbi:protein no-on-transient A-like [Drosophila innubila]|uniref:protein no-on-transient A-like n=1 Tax=Drosophila innubila TaxID=198719 RepID=UPI00148C51D1|nr:protein no-on-transient A-like [Drosophila innubila]
MEDISPSNEKIIDISPDKRHEEQETVVSVASNKKPRLSREKNIQIWAKENQVDLNQPIIGNDANASANAQSDAQSYGQSYGQSHVVQSRGNRGRNSGSFWAHGENRGKNRSGNNKNGHSQRNEEFFIGQRLRQINGPTTELDSTNDIEEFKFSGRNRLYVGNLTSEMTSEEKIRELFKPYGELGDIFINTEKNFAFVKVDYHTNAEKAKRALDGTTVSGRQLRVRFAPNQTVVRVSNLSPYVSNELLQKSFEIFGTVERAIIMVDDRGNHTGEGIVEFATKTAVNHCLRLCHENCFFLTASLRPCIVELNDINDDNDGMPEKALSKTMQYNNERNIGPRFADPDSFEHEYGFRWKQLHALYKTKMNSLKRELKLEEEKLDAQMDYIRNERETELLRQELRQREAENERRKMELEMRQKQYQEVNLLESAALIRRQNQVRDNMMKPETPFRPQNQENDMMRIYKPQNSNGFGGICDYNARSMSFESSPFVVFGDEKENCPNNQDGNIPVKDGQDLSFEDMNRNNMNREFGNDGGLWGRRSI